MKLKFKSESGVITIDAILGLTVFMGAVLSLMFMTLMIRVQSTVQYALSQTAKEISGYYYLLDKVGVTKVMANAKSNDPKVQKVDETIGYVLDFADGTRDMSDKVSSLNFSDVNVGEMAKLGEDVYGQGKSLYETANNLAGNLSTIADDPVGNIRAVLSVFAKSMVNKGVSYYIVPPVCRAVMPKYLAGDLSSSDEMLENMGVEGGLSKIDFSQSQLLADGRSIKLVAIYKLNTKKMTFGLIDQDLIFRSAASTAAWVAPDDSNTMSLNKIPTSDVAAPPPPASGSGSEPAQTGTGQEKPE